MEDLNLSNDERRTFDYHTYENVSDEDKVLIKRVFRDICDDNKYKFSKVFARTMDDFKQQVRYDLDSIEDEIISYSIDDLSNDESKYLRDMFESFKKEV